MRHKVLIASIKPPSFSINQKMDLFSKSASMTFKLVCLYKLIGYHLSQ